MQTIEEVPALKVSPVATAKSIADASLSVMVDAPKLIARVLELFEEKLETDTD